MRPAAALAGLVLLASGGLGCQQLDPSAYRLAARSLQFRLHRLDPRLQLAFPLDQSSLVVRVQVEVTNPSDLPLDVVRAGGTLHLQVDGRRLRILDLAFPAGIHLEPRAKALMEADLRLGYREVEAALTPLRRTLVQGAPGTWELEGQATARLLGLDVTLPFHVRRTHGDPS